jgi:hypothetical protein
MNSLPADVLRGMCTFLDARSLANLERTHKCEWTDFAWAELVSTRLQFSLVNRAEFLANPRAAARCIFDGWSDEIAYHYQDTQELLYQTQAWANVLARLVHTPPTEVSRNPLLIALSRTSPLQGPIDHSHVESHFLRTKWAEMWSLSVRGLGRYTTLVQFYHEHGVFYRQWMRIRELAQRGIVRSASFYRELVPGEDVCHAVVRVYGGSLCGLHLLKKPEASLTIQVSRIDAVCNGVVQFRAILNFNSEAQVFGPVGWASRCDMLVLGEDLMLLT